MTQVIKVLVVDDKPKFAKNFCEIVDAFPSKFKNTSYQATYVAGLNTYVQAKDYILHRQHEIDIVMIDYNIGKYLKGIDLIRLINRKKYLIYKILHSVTDDTLTKTQDDLHKEYDHFCESKGETKIVSTLEKYEKNILSIKLFGNIKFRKTFMVNETREMKKMKSNTFADISFFNILWGETDKKSKERITVCFRDDITKRTDKRTRTTHAVLDFTESEFPFKRINQSFFINMLWVSKIDLVNKTINFIGLNNEVIEIPYMPTEDCFNIEILPLFNEIDLEMPTFFKS